MTSVQHHIGQRLSLKSRLCTVRYVGPVADKAGDWLGVEWDDPQRGKHNGTHAGVSYFRCQSSSLLAGSFLRPTQPWDQPRSFLQALKEKYAPTEAVDESEVVHVSASKKIEEVGYEKLARRQAQLQGIRTIVLDQMRIRHDAEENSLVSETCEGVANLDIIGNLFETLDEVLNLCCALRNLTSLTLDGNRFTVSGLTAKSVNLERIKTLSLSNTLLDWDTEVTTLLEKHFSRLETLIATQNEWDSLGYGEESLHVPSSLRSLDISNNGFTALDHVELSSETRLQTLLIKRNHISKVHTTSSNNQANLPSWFQTVEELDVRHNNIFAWSFVDDLALMPNLQHLRVSGNPLYQGSQLPDVEEKLAGTDDTYMLTIARLPHLKTLNYSSITEKERLNAETYYLNKIAAEITADPSRRASILQQHPRWAAMCEAYGEPAILDLKSSTEGEVDANSLAARLLKITFHTSFPKPQTWTERLPKSLNVYSLLGQVSKRLHVTPLKLRLIFETGEKDPVGHGREGNAYDGPEWWDSEEEESASQVAGVVQWMPREVPLVPGTRAIGTYVDGVEARVRIDVKIR